MYNKLFSFTRSRTYSWFTSIGGNASGGASGGGGASVSMIAYRDISLTQY